MQTTLIVLCTIALAHSAVEARYGSGGLRGGRSGGNGGVKGYGASGGSGNALGGGGSDSYSNDDTFSLGGGSVMRLAMPDFEQTGPSYQQSSGSPVSAAVQTKRTVEVKPVRMPEDHAEPHVVDVEASIQPVHVIFRSASNPVMVQQIHKPSDPNKVERTQSEDEPHRVQHQVTRPVIQEVREIIQPYRRILQEIRPVLEEVRTVVAKAADGPGSNGGQGYDSNENGGGRGAGGGNGGYGSSSGRNNNRGSDSGYGGGRSERGNESAYAGSSASFRSSDRGGNDYGSASAVSYSDSAPSISVVPSPMKFVRVLRKSQHSRRIGSIKRYSRRA